MQTGGPLPSPQFWPWVRPCYTNLLPSHTLFCLLPPFYSPPPFIFSFPLTVLPRRRKLHIAVLTFLFEMSFVGVEQGCLWSKGFWCLSTHPPQPFLPILPVSSSWVHAVIKEDCWCVINLFKRRRKSKTRNFVPTKAYFNFILLFSSLEIKPLGMFFGNMFLKCISLQKESRPFLAYLMEQLQC